jgi:hypothetical protein
VNELAVLVGVATRAKRNEIILVVSAEFTSKL